LGADQQKVAIDINRKLLNRQPVFLDAPPHRPRLERGDHHPPVMYDECVLDIVPLTVKLLNSLKDRPQNLLAARPIRSDAIVQRRVLVELQHGFAIANEVGKRVTMTGNEHPH
jgi:hypothetical protein